MTTEQERDPKITELRQQISDVDRHIVDLVNKRLKLVAKIKDYKESRGIGFVDHDREQWMRRFLHRTNKGPLTADGLDELFKELLDLTKREVSKG